jgi:hypothetical protein
MDKVACRSSTRLKPLLAFFLSLIFWRLRWRSSIHFTSGSVVSLALVGVVTVIKVGSPRLALIVEIGLPGVIVGARAPLPSLAGRAAAFVFTVGEGLALRTVEVLNTLRLLLCDFLRSGTTDGWDCGFEVLVCNGAKEEVVDRTSIDGLRDDTLVVLLVESLERRDFRSALGCFLSDSDFALDARSGREGRRVMLATRRTSSKGAWPLVVFILCAYVQTSLQRISDMTFLELVKHTQARKRIHHLIDSNRPPSPTPASQPSKL